MQSGRKERRNFIVTIVSLIFYYALSIWKDIVWQNYRTVIKITYLNSILRFLKTIWTKIFVVCHLSFLGTWQTFQKNLSNVTNETNEICTTIKFVKKKETYLFSINVSSSDRRRRKASLREEERKKEEQTTRNRRSGEKKKKKRKKRATGERGGLNVQRRWLRI